MERIITIEIPSDVALSLNMSDSDLKDEIKNAAIFRLYELGKISSGIAAKALNVSRLEFFDILSKNKISSIGFSNPNDFKNEMNSGE